jgi:hypothetical protein
MDKGIILSPNKGLGFTLTEFHRFWCFYVSAGDYQEKEKR